MSVINRLGLTFTRTIHYGLMMFVGAPMCCDDKWVLRTHAIFIPSMILSWRIAGGRCILNVAENHFRKRLGEETVHYIMWPPYTTSTRTYVVSSVLMATCLIYWIITIMKLFGVKSRLWTKIKD